tara:strand:+ start:116 stop:583 length:468 start_codon:yes stop_codon:yes gene_type:complete
MVDIIGQILELGNWFHRDASEDEKTKCKEQLIGAFAEARIEKGLIFSKLEFDELPWDHERVKKNIPPGPDMMLMVCYATVTGVELGGLPEEAGFVTDLDKKDRDRLREITRNAQIKKYPDEAPLTDAECDTIIGKLGLAMIERELREATDKGEVH